MKNMRSLQQRRRSSFGLGRIAAIIGVCCILGLVVVRPVWLERLFIETAVSSSFIREALADTADGVRTGMMSVQEVVDEIVRVREENTQLRLRAALYDEMRAERDRLYSRFGRDVELRGVLGHVLASPARSPYDTFILDIGSADGVSTGDAVLFDSTLSVGVIESTSQHGARVRLFSSPAYESQVSIGTSTALVTAVGRGGGSFELRVPKDLPVAVDDALMLVGAQRGALGFVQSVEARDADSFQTVYATSPINLFETREVLVIPR